MKVQSVYRLRYVLDGPGIDYRMGKNFSAPVLSGSGATLASYTMGTDSLSHW